MAGKVDSTKLYPLDNALALVKECADREVRRVDRRRRPARHRRQEVRPGRSRRGRDAFTAPARPSASPCSPKAPRPRKPRPPAPTSSAWTTSPPRSRPARWTSTSSSPRPTRCASSARSARSSGPRGLMPNPKVGTVTPDVAQAVRNAKAGQVQFRVDKAGIVHATIGRRSFDDRQAGRQPARADRGAEQVQAGVEQGHLSAEGRAVVDRWASAPGSTCASINAPRRRKPA